MTRDKISLTTIALILVGCSSQHKLNPQEKTDAGVVTAGVVKVKQLTDEQKIALLRAEAHRRKLRWHIYCVEDVSWNFQASATKKSQPVWAQYLEDSAKDYWIETGMTQAEAAYALFQAIQEPGNFHPDHRPGTGKNHKLCPPELKGE